MINITPKPLDIDLQVGSDHSETISTRLLFTIGDFELNFETSEDAKENIEKIDKLLNQINSQMSDIALEATKFAHAQILQQVGISLLTQTINHNRGFVQRLLGI